jgi:uncharacterized membrane protein
MERVLGQTLKVGVFLSSLCLGVGLSWQLVAGAQSPAGLLLTSGLVILFATPIARVAASTIEYAIERDWLFTALTLFVLLELGAGVVVAIYGSRA